MHIIDSVLEPLVPISLRQAEYFVNLDASKLLSKSTLYDLGGHRMRIFHQVENAILSIIVYSYEELRLGCHDPHLMSYYIIYSLPQRLLI